MIVNSLAKPLVDAVTFPITAVSVVAICAFIDWFTAPGHWWFHWVAFGMVIALIGVWGRALKFLIVSAGVAGLGGLIYLAYRRWHGRDIRCGPNVSGT